ncbi:hypothetical protein MGWOODY_XGa393 [hydrothermal vent metagenome]|uniref:Uncharacterized protein n=1 Tax=hydrothermal vent metagenome TaxID=652676 RepID=A0A160TST2_9ZZZZ
MDTRRLTGLSEIHSGEFAAPYDGNTDRMVTAGSLAQQKRQIHGISLVSNCQ